MDRIGNRSNGFETFMIFILGLAAIGVSISFYFTGMG